MSRIITKPEDANPRETHPTAHNNYIVEKFFTIAECAQIARKYATAFYKENRYAETIGMKHKTAEEWRAKFKEWENES